MKTDDLFLSTTEFLDLVKVQHHSANDRPFCWVLGSGASRQSDIPLGRVLTTQWLKEMYDEATHSDPKPSIEDWANKTFGDIEGFDFHRAVNFHAYIYQRRYQGNPNAGYAFLEALIKKAAPSIGYSVLSQMMTATRHKLAITTNFDDLLSHALVKYTGVIPFDCGYESLASYVSLNLDRPITAKLYRDLLLAPKTNPNELARLPQHWEEPLTRVFEQFTPIIIGFGDSGGGGGSLTRFLETLPPIAGGVYWCYREKTPGARPSDEVQSLVRRHNGRIIPILGFDEVMLQFWDKLSFTSLQHELQQKHERDNQVAADYLNEFVALAERIIALEGSVDTETIKAAVKAAKSVLKQLGEDLFQ